MAKTKFFRVFTEGDTTDGRVIQRPWIEQMAATYNPALYGARVWLEHMRSLYPDSVFRAYGDVIAVKSEKLDDGRLALYAQIDPTDDLIAINKARQKVYTSAEIDPDFAKTGKCYLTGLAVTDSPASLSTEMLAFAAQATTNPLTARKQTPGSLFTAAVETTLEFEDTMTTPATDKPLLDQIKALFATSKPTDLVAGPDLSATTTAAVLELGTQMKTALEGFNTQLATSTKATADQVTALTTQLADSAKAFTELKAAHDKLLTDFTALATNLDTDPATGKPRPDATGGNPGTGNKPDCL